MNKQLLSAVIVSSIIAIPNVTLGATAEAAVAPEGQQAVYSEKETIAALQQEMNVLRERLAKVEKQSDKIELKQAEKKEKVANSGFTFYGDSRIRWINKHDDAVKPLQERVRLGMNKQINEEISMNLRLKLIDNNTFGSGNGVTDTGTKTADLEKDTVRLTDANFMHKGLFGADAVTLGRFSHKFLSNNYWITSDGGIDGIKVTMGANGPLKINGIYANWNVLTQGYIRDAFAVDATYKVSPATEITAMYLKEVASNKGKQTIDAVTAVPADAVKFDVRGIGLKTKLSKDFSFEGDYTQNVAMSQGIGYYYSLGYKEANKKIKNSWGLNLEYRKIEANNHVTAKTGAAVDVTNVKGPVFAAHYVPYENCMINAYQTFNSKWADSGEAKPNYSRIEVVYSW